MARKINDEADARRCLRAAAVAGKSAGEWARAHGVDGRSLHAWKLAIARRGLRATARRRVPARAGVACGLVELVPTATAVAPGTSRYVLEVGGARVEFGEDASVAMLRRVLEVLRSC